VPASVSPDDLTRRGVGESGDVDDGGDGGDVDAVAFVARRGGLEDELEEGVVAALCGGAPHLLAVGVGCGLLGAVALAGASVDGVADDFAGFGGEVGVAAPGPVE
jgi:hypothetical protein